MTTRGRQNAETGCFLQAGVRITATPERTELGGASALTGPNGTSHWSTGAHLEVTDASELRTVVSADASEAAGGVITHPQVALLL